MDRSLPIEIKDKIKCTACAACINICPSNCITMRPDHQGFFYPAIDTIYCSSCESCTSVCPILTGVSGIAEIQNLKVYAAFSKDDQIREQSSSGGLFSELALAVLKNGGLVVGAGFSDVYTVKHTIIDREEDLGQLRKSKYVQSEIGLLFRKIKKHLVCGKIVMFSGTPCQTAGLQHYLDEDYSNLIMIDIICHSINSPKAYVCWLKEIEFEQQKRAIRVEFRHKIDGWRKSSWRTRVDFEDGSSTVVNKTEGTFMGGFLKGHLFTRPSCSDCRFKGNNRVSDITIADFWGIPPEFNDDKGVSQVIINSKKGDDLFRLVEPRIFFCERSYTDVLLKNPMYAKSTTINANSEIFFYKLEEKPFSQAMYECCSL